MVKVIVAGCAGRMGKRIGCNVMADEAYQLVGGFEFVGHDAVGRDLGEVIGCGNLGVDIVDNLAEVIDCGDVIIDFTSPESTMNNLDLALKHKKGIVIGSTGLSKQQEKKIETVAEKIPVVYAPNMSLGVNLLFKLAKEVASALSDDYDIEIVEAHHRHKKDSPSGTACELAKQVAAGRQVSLEKNAVYGREGLCGERPRGEIGVHAVRGGDVVGEHTVSFMTMGERIELTHRASSRDAFAKGSVVAAGFISSKKKGLYNMQNVLGI